MFQIYEVILFYTFISMKYFYPFWASTPTVAAQGLAAA